MIDVPTGTVTFLFTDIEGSTRLARRNALAWEAARARHHAILRTASLVGPAFGRRSLAVNALAVSALAMAVQSPIVIWDAGFQLSFAATLGLIVMATPLTNSYHQWLIRHVASVALCTLIVCAGTDLMVTVAATLATLPIRPGVGSAGAASSPFG